MGTVAQITDPKTKEQIPVFISRDRQTNELEYMREDRIYLPNKICGAKLTDKHKEELMAGRPVRLDNMVSQKGNEFSAMLQISAVKRGVEFLPKEVGMNQQQTNRPFQWIDEIGNINAPKTIGSVTLTEQQKLDFQAEKPIYLKGMVKDGQEQPYNAYIKFDRWKDQRSDQRRERSAETGTAETNRSPKRETGERAKSRQAQEIKRLEDVRLWN